VPIADDETTAWIRRYHPAATSRKRLVCFPHAGGAATYYRPVSAYFSPEVDVIALQYPGRQDRRREPCVDDLGLLADRVTEQLLELTGKPTVFFGHSMGATLAFEVAWRLEHKGANAPYRLVASGRRAPSTRRDEKVHLQDDDGIIAELRRLDGTDTALLDDEMLRIALPAIRSDYRAIESYTCEPGRRVDAPITVLTGDADAKTSLEEADAWRRHTNGEFRLKVFSGGHFFIGEQPAAVNAAIAADLGP
jgi:surfactin synthase thioesterase subunit